MAGRALLGIDLGGTKILAGVVDADNRVLARAKRPTPAREGQAAILAAIVSAARDAIDQSKIDVGDLIGVGIGAPGPLDIEAGVIRFSPNLDVKDFAIGPELAKELGKPVLVRNDVRVGGYGEFKLGAGRGKRDIIAAFVGTGIGGCFIKDGQIVPGFTGNAGEIGHMIIKAGGPVCGCGSHGCLEALASRTAIARRVRKAIRKGIPTALKTAFSGKDGRLKSRELAAAAAIGDSVAVNEIHRAAIFLGLGLASLINIVGPELVIIGGGVVEALGASYVDLVRAEARRHTIGDPDGLVPIVAADLGDDAGILGASLMAREAFE